VALDLDQQPRAEPRTLAIGGDGQPSHLGRARIGRIVPQAHRRDQPPAIADAERRYVGRAELCPQLGERLPERRQPGSACAWASVT
jgi:hypothetical protein